jgi:hypothetical protein
LAFDHPRLEGLVVMKDHQFGWAVFTNQKPTNVVYMGVWLRYFTNHHPRKMWVLFCLIA